MIRANYHSHLVYCNHAVGHAEDYIKVALEHNFVALGISDHAPVLPCFMSQKDFERFGRYYRTMTLDTMYQGYLKEMALAKEKYKNKIKVLIGFETEYLPTNEFFVKLLRSKVDYLNLGAHIFNYKGQILNTYTDTNFETIYGYLEACIQGMETGVFNTLVHPDLFMYNYKDENGDRVFDAHCKKVSTAIIEAAIQNNVYLELNANGIFNSRNSKEWLYPYKEFWEIAAKYKDLKIIIGADAHKPEALVCEYVEMAERFAKKLGLKLQDLMEVNH